MGRYWSRLARKLEPYVPGEQPGDGSYIKLNTNENPYGPSPKVLDAVRRAAGENLRLYPDPTCDAFISAVAERYGVKKDQVFAGNGSDEVLAFSFMAFFDPDRTIVFPEITYSFYPVYAQLFGLDYATVPLDPGFNIRPELMKSSGGVVIANPNAPTGRALPLSAIRSILDGNPEAVVIVDEAYVDFGGESAVGLINEYPNLLVIHTFSKSRALAGMRIGLAFGDSGLIRAIERIKNSFNSYTMDRLALTAGIAALEDEEYYRDVIGRIIKTREWFTAELRKRGFSVPDSSANFVFASHSRVHAGELYHRLRENRILVRYFKKPQIDNHLRITIGTDEEMRTVVEVLDRIL
ncbi:MAG TPA: histidinol-phosphate transaminase [Clostridiales bacterium]|nr:histidinol-phosphate transaminase [Clostridiales bacterium]HPV01027.1 histidinol-phosphate transaminase [Clostridiales bacterium]